MSALFVPIQIDGLYLPANRLSAGPFADFTNLPWVGGTPNAAWDVNASAPWITETAARDPLGGPSAELEAGVHLHWALPDRLTRARHPLVEGKRDQSRLEFPSVPNRWLVVRRTQGVVQKSWIIESDYLWPERYPWGQITRDDFIKGMDGAAQSAPLWDYLCSEKMRWLWPAADMQSAQVADKSARLSNDLGAYARLKVKIARVLHEAGHASFKEQRKLTNYPLSNVDSDGFSKPGNPPYRFMGRKRLLSEPWSQDHGEFGDPAYLTDSTKLTAVGYGEPTFAAFYPNSRSVFGFHDEVDGAARAYVYDVYGWYSDPPADILAQPQPGGLSLNEERAEDFSKRLEDTLKWTPEGEVPTATPKASLFYGRIRAAHFVPPSKGRIAGQIQPAVRPIDQETRPDSGLLRTDNVHVAIANSGTEALSSYLADRMAWARHGARRSERVAEKKKIETYLEALHLAPDLQHRQLDVGAKTAEQRHAASFDARPGGHIWTILHAREDRAHGQNRSEAQMNLPDDLAADLSTLNRLQNAYEQGKRGVDALRWQIYSDWYRYMRYAYHQDDEAYDLHSSRNGHDVDIAIAYLRQGAMKALRDLIADLGEIERREDSNGDVTLSARAGSGLDSAAAKLLVAWQTVNDKIRAHNVAAKSEAAKQAEGKGEADTWALKDLPAPRFYAPADPVLLIANGPFAPTDRHDADHKRNPQGYLECQYAPVDVSALNNTDPGAVDATAKELIKTLGPKLDRLERDSPTRIGFRHKSRMAGHPFMLEWQVEIAPVRTHALGSSGGRRYPPDFIHANWQLDETNCALGERPNLSVRTKRPSILRGRGFFSSHAQELTRARLEDYIAKRLEAYFDANAVADDQRGIAYLDRNYAEVRHWFVDQGIQRTSAEDGRELMRLQKASGAGAVNGIPSDGCLAEAILLVINHLSGAELRDKLRLEPALVLHLLLHRAGAEFLDQTFFGGADRLALIAKVQTALGIDAASRPAIRDSWREFLGLLIQAMSPEDYLVKARARGVSEMTWQPKGPAPFVAFVAALLADEKAGDILAKPERLAVGVLGNPFVSLAQLAALGVLNTEGEAIGAAVFARVLRFAQFNDYFKQPEQDHVIVEERPSVIGLPTGGPIEAAMVALVNGHLAAGDDYLTRVVGLPASIARELQLEGPVQSLLEIKSRRAVT